MYFSLIAGSLLTALMSCSKSNSSQIKADGGTIQGISRWTPYDSEQEGKGSCGVMRNYSNDSKQWAAVSEKFATEVLGYAGCINRGTTEAPDCYTHAINSICGKKLQVRCTSGECQSQPPHEVVIVDVCPAYRGYHDIADPGSKGDTACADSYVIDLDESLWYKVWSPGASYVNNVSLEISLNGGTSAPSNNASPEFSSQGATPAVSSSSISSGHSGGGSSGGGMVGGYTCEQQKGWGKCGESWMSPVCDYVCR
jgi:hypothetical protein